MKNIKKFEDFDNINEATKQWNVKYCPNCGSKTLKLNNSYQGTCEYDRDDIDGKGITNFISPCKDFHCSSCNKDIVIEVDEKFIKGNG